MKKLSTLFLSLFLAAGNLSGQEPADTQVVSFRFVPGSDMFYIPWAGNGAELERLYAWVDEYRTEIATGRMPVRVDGYCSSLSTAKENLTTAYIRASRVKSELITHKGLKEADFITANYAQPHDGCRDLVVVTLRIPAPAEPQPAKSAPQPAPEPTSEAPVPAAEPHPAPVPAVEPHSAPAPAPAPPAAPAKPLHLVIRTNLLYDALLLPTLGVEWRVNRRLGIKLDASRSWWGDETGKVQKIWLLNPEVRWYPLRDKRFYIGVSGNFGQYNIYKYATGSILSKDTGYQGSLWGAGLTVGYQLPLARRLALDFSLGLGYTRFDYDTFGIVDGVRMHKERDCIENFWGPTQVGISLLWTIGGKR